MEFLTRLLTFEFLIDLNELHYILIIDDLKFISRDQFITQFVKVFSVSRRYYAKF